MPQLDSNQDVRQNDLFNKVLLGSAAIVGAAALGQSMGKNMSSLFKNWGKSSGSKVAKGLYGDAAEKFGREMTDSITTAGRNADGPQYKLKNKILGGQKVKRTDGSWMDKMRSNRSDDVKGFNTQLKDLHDGRRFSDSKLSMYEDIMEGSSSRNINLDSKQGMNATENAYNSKASSRTRKELGVNNLADDAELTSAIWDTPSNTEKYKPAAQKFDGDNFQDAIKNNPQAQEKIKYAGDRAKMDQRDIREQANYQGQQERKANTKKAMQGLNETERKIKSQKESWNNNMGEYADEKHKVNMDTMFPNNNTAPEVNKVSSTSKGLDEYADNKHSVNTDTMFGGQAKPNQSYVDNIKNRESRKGIKYQSGKDSNPAPKDGEAFGMNLGELRKQSGKKVPDFTPKEGESFGMNLDELRSKYNQNPKANTPEAIAKRESRSNARRNKFGPTDSANQNIHKNSQWKDSHDGEGYWKGIMGNKNPSSR